jgi:ATP/maltotriose-dependent transcriptional regulator MalT
MDGRVHLGSGASATELIGRAKECRALAELLDAARAGQSRVLVVRGDAGIGKTALLQSLIDSAQGFRVVYATGVESEMELPFAVLHQLCASMLDRLTDLPDPQRDAARTVFGLATGTAPDRLLVGLAILNLLSLTSEDSPLLCVVDDAQWLDRASLQALAFVARRLLADRIAMVFATRHRTAELAEFPELSVVGLRDGDAHTLLSAVLNIPLDRRVRDRIVAETHGNPLALVEGSREITQREFAGGFGLPQSTPLSGQIEDGYRRRVADLPPLTQKLLTVAAAEPTGDAVTVWRAAQALGVDPHDAAPAVEAGLVDIGLRVRFRHPLVRSAAYVAAGVADRQAAHRALAEATDPEVEPDRRAWHLALGSPGPNEDVASALEESAIRARARGGLAAEAALLERSVAMTLDPSLRTQRLIGAATAHLEAGSYEIAGRLVAAAEATELDDTGRGHVELLRARHTALAGDVRHADVPGLMVRAAKRFEMVDADLASSTYLHAMVAASNIGNQGTVGLREVGLAASTCPMPTVLTMKDWLLVGLSRVATEGLAAAAPALRRALEETTNEKSVSEAALLLGFRSAAANFLWDIEEFRKSAVTHLALTRELGALTALPIALSTLAHVLVLEGDLVGAESLKSEIDQILVATEISHSLLMSGVTFLAGLQGAEVGERAIDDQIAFARARGFPDGVPSSLWASAILYNGTGQYENALAVARRANEQPWPAAQRFFAELIEAAVRCGQSAVASATCEQLADSTQAAGTDWALGVEARCRALLGSGTAAEDLFREAIDRLGRTTLRPDLARAHLLYGESLRRENRRVDARAELRTAHEMFTTMGIHGFAERTRLELVATGETVRKRTLDSFDSLTPQEAHIARLAADGHTNPDIGTQLFISARTVEWHLRKVFTKVGVSSRKELRDALQQKRVAG